MDVKILLIGSRGQLGRDIQRCAANNFSQFSLQCVDVDELDITQAETTLRFCQQHQPAFIINCAAYTAVDKAEDEPEKAYDINVTGVSNLTSAAAAVNAYLIHISTDYVFDGRSNKPYTEGDATNPLSVYGKTKLAGEQAALSYERSLVIRTAWLYAIEGNNFVNTMLRLGNERSSINVVNDQYGSPTYAYDLAEAILFVIKQVTENAANFRKGIFHYTNDGAVSWFEFARKVMEFAQLSCNVLPVASTEYPTKAPRPSYSVLSKKKIEQTYHLTIPSWENGLQRYFEQKNNIA